jgi:hypothetical protein
MDNKHMTIDLLSLVPTLQMYVPPFCRWSIGQTSQPAMLITSTNVKAKLLSHLKEDMDMAKGN